MEHVPFKLWFYYLIDLHYSQTSPVSCLRSPSFYYLIDLHYSQTSCGFNRVGCIVLLPYRFTLFSNLNCNLIFSNSVLLPYRFTLFSNSIHLLYYLLPVLLPYRFTLFSNIGNGIPQGISVLLPYRFTLFSNLKLKIKCTHYTVHGKSIRLFYNICIMNVNKIRTNHYQSQQVFRIQKLLSALSFQC